MRRIGWMVFLLAGCAIRYEGLCDEATALQEQQECVDDVAAQARVDVDERLTDEIERAREEEARERLRDRASACRRAIAALAKERREELATLERQERRRRVDETLDDLAALVRRCHNALEDEREGTREEREETREEREESSEGEREEAERESRR